MPVVSGSRTIRAPTPTSAYWLRKPSDHSVPISHEPLDSTRNIQKSWNLVHYDSSSDIGRVVIAKACPIKNILCFVHLACFITLGTYFNIYIADKLENY